MVTTIKNPTTGEVLPLQKQKEMFTSKMNDAFPYVKINWTNQTENGSFMEILPVKEETETRTLQESY